MNILNPFVETNETRKYRLERRDENTKDWVLYYSLYNTKEYAVGQFQVQIKVIEKEHGRTYIWRIVEVTNELVFISTEENQNILQC